MKKFKNLRMIQNLNNKLKQRQESQMNCLPILDSLVKRLFLLVKRLRKMSPIARENNSHTNENVVK